MCYNRGAEVVDIPCDIEVVAAGAFNLYDQEDDYDYKHKGFPELPFHLEANEWIKEINILAGVKKIEAGAFGKLCSFKKTIYIPKVLRV